jgi:hypothetical protein
MFIEAVNKNHSGEGGIKMKKILKLMVFFTLVAMTAVSYTTAWADGAPEPPIKGCENPPVPTNQSPVIHGTFTASYFMEFGQKPKYYSIQIVLKTTKVITDKKTIENLENPRADCAKMKTEKMKTDKGKEIQTGNLEKCPGFKSAEIDVTRLHTFQKYIVIDKKLCEYTNNDLVSLYWARPCNVAIQKEFDLKGHAVLSDIKITNRNHCDDMERAAISGTFKIRVVP